MFRGKGVALLEALRGNSPVTGDFVRRYIRPNENTEFGKLYHFKGIRSYEDYREAVPLQRYVDLEPWIRRAVAGEGGMLTAETPLGFEITSGTSNAAKLIPVTAGFQRELASALSLWMMEWERRYPGVFDGPAYWSISPRLGDSKFGFDDDGAYFPEEIRMALAQWLVVPELKANDTLFEKTAEALMATSDLRAVSVWSPVFLLKLDEALGTKRSWKALWPELRVVSCWADAQAGVWMQKVKDRLGDGIVFEPKGLLATEGVTSIPIAKGNVIAVGVHFHEFVDVESGEVVCRVAPNRRYEVILTTAAGLYRYQTGDIIEIDSNDCVRFVGRKGDNSDLAGEKLDAEQVIDAFKLADDSGFVRISRMRYDIWARCPDRILEYLRRNAHFRRALESGELEPCGKQVLPDDWQSVSTRYLAETRGGREGDVKLPVLERGEMMELWVS